MEEKNTSENIKSELFFIINIERWSGGQVHSKNFNRSNQVKFTC